MHPGMTHYPQANTPVRVPDIVNAMRDPGFLPNAWGKQLGVGNALYDAYQSQNTLQKLGVMPGIGDAAGFMGDLQSMYQNPEERTVPNALLAGAGLVPFVPAGLGTVGKMNKARKIKNAYHGTIEEFEDFKPGPNNVNLFTSVKRNAQEYGDVKEFDLDMRYPLELDLRNKAELKTYLDTVDWEKSVFADNADEALEVITSGGYDSDGIIAELLFIDDYDGGIFHNYETQGDTVYLTTDPAQISPSERGSQ